MLDWNCGVYFYHIETRWYWLMLQVEEFYIPLWREEQFPVWCGNRKHTSYMTRTESIYFIWPALLLYFMLDKWPLKLVFVKKLRISFLIISFPRLFTHSLFHLFIYSTSNWWVGSTKGIGNRMMNRKDGSFSPWSTLSGAADIFYVDIMQTI